MGAVVRRYDYKGVARAFEHYIWGELGKVAVHSPVVFRPFKVLALN
jgi:hypothetical protein